MKIRLPVTMAIAASVPVLLLMLGAAARQQTSTQTNDSKATSQPIPRLADGHPDLNGFYASSSGPDTPVGATFGPRPRGAGRRPGGGDEIAAATARHDDPNQPPYKPELLAKVEGLAKMESKYDPAFYCK